LGLILSYRCTNGCAHCLYNCGPKWERQPISAQTLQEALKAIAIWPQTPQVHFTGGEPFLYFDLLLQGVRYATQLGIPRYVETSASWCTDEAKTIQQFAALEQAGLQAILISCSPFHAERIPPIRTMRAIQAALDVFGKERVIVYLPGFIEVLQQFDLERPTPLSRYEQAFGAERARQILWQGYGIISGGRAGYHLGQIAAHYAPAEFKGENCNWELLYGQHSHFDLYGNFIPSFCGGLTVGSWRKLPQILADFQAGHYPPLIQLLVERGPYGLLKMAQAKFGYTPLAEGYTGKCHLCVDVRRHLAAAGNFAELRPQGFYENL
jgi:hypothetical protein